MSILLGDFRYDILAEMRIKLVLLTAMLGAVFGGVVALGAIALTLGRAGLILVRYNYHSAPAVAGVIILILLVAASLAAVFVYRHTARRRIPQGVLTGILTLLLSAGLYYSGAMFMTQ